MSYRVRALMLLIVVFTSLAAVAKDVDVVIKQTNNRLTATGVAEGDVIDASGSDVILKITCDEGIDCTPIAISIGGAEPSHAPEMKGRTKSLTIDAASLTSTATNVVIRNGQKERLLGFKLRNGNAAAATPPGGNTGACVPQPLPETYFRDRNQAHFVVTPGGSILQYPDGPIDEDDTVVIHVFGPDTEVARIEVARTSATRTTGQLVAVGAGTNMTDLLKESLESVVCIERTFTLGDFAPGEATVEMYTVAAGTKTTLGSFKFNVNALYQGIMSFGPAWTRHTGDTSFHLTPSGTDKIITATEEGGRNIVYTLGYTYFVWGRRDLEKTYPAYMHLNPTIAVSTSKFNDHAFAGATFDLGQILVTAGAHFAHVTRLSTASGLVPGSKFSGQDADIPTAKRWEGHPFIAVTVDLRAAAALLKAVSGK